MAIAESIFGTKLSTISDDDFMALIADTVGEMEMQWGGGDLVGIMRETSSSLMSESRVS